uniref:Uncharacterized protein n=1 Tax=Oryza sativa subsp. japonica TaxID=39947 RepID=Q8S6N6_ORYSJ|nr:hypothetical protein [Oryza sativa Japonica Group]
MEWAAGGENERRRRASEGRSDDDRMSEGRSGELCSRRRRPRASGRGAVKAELRAPAASKERTARRKARLPPSSPPPLGPSWRPSLSPPLDPPLAPPPLKPGGRRRLGCPVTRCRRLRSSRAASAHEARGEAGCARRVGLEGWRGRPRAHEGAKGRLDLDADLDVAAKQVGVEVEAVARRLEASVVCAAPSPDAIASARPASSAAAALAGWPPPFGLPVARRHRPSPPVGDVGEEGGRERRDRGRRKKKGG